MRIGFGKDIHILKKGFPLILGGVKIPFKKGLVSYSDGDCLIHSLVDAILGALAKGDIGTLFPDNDLKNKGRNSVEFLKEANDILKSENYKISNIDIFISCERPKLKDFIPSIRENLGEILDISTDKISVKAGSNEKMGYIGKNKAIECISVILLEEI